MKKLYTLIFLFSLISPILKAQNVPKITASVLNASCQGGPTGAITITVTGGTPPYTYSWSNGATSQSIQGLAQGYYFLWVTDATDTKALDSIYVDKINNMSILADTINNVSCHGGSDGAIHIAVSGGKTPYIYQWNPGVTIPGSIGGTTPYLKNIPAAYYDIAVTDAAGCSKTATFAVSEPAAIDFTERLTPETCRGAGKGSIRVDTVTGGVPPFSFSLNNQPFSSTSDFTGLPDGSYTLTVRDANSCTESHNLTISSPTDTANAGPDIYTTSTSTSLNAIVQSGTWAILKGTATIVNISDPETAIAGLSQGENVFLWEHNASGCYSTDTVSVFVSANSLIDGPSEITPGTSNLFTVPETANATYEWTVPDFAQIDSGQNTPNLYVSVKQTQSTQRLATANSATATGNIVCTITAPDGAKIIEKPLSVTQATATIYPASAGQASTVSPNPFNESTVIKIASEQNTPLIVRIFNASGTEVYYSDKYHSNENITLGSELIPGIYQIQAIENNKMQILRMIKY